MHEYPIPAAHAGYNQPKPVEWENSFLLSELTFTQLRDLVESDDDEVQPYNLKKLTLCLLPSSSLYPISNLVFPLWQELLTQLGQLESLTIDMDTVPLSMDVIKQVILGNKESLRSVRLLAIRADNVEVQDRVLDMTIFRDCSRLQTLELSGKSSSEISDWVVVRDEEYKEDSDEEDLPLDNGYILADLHTLPLPLEHLSLTFFHILADDYLTITNAGYFCHMKSMHFIECTIDWDLDNLDYN